MLDNFTKLVLVLILTAAVIAGGYIGYQRYALETARNTIELAIDLRDVKLLSALSKYPVDKLLTELKDRDIVSIGVMEQTLIDATLSGDLFFVSGAGIHQFPELSPYLTDLAKRGYIDPKMSYVYCEDPQVRRRVQRQLHHVLPPAAFRNLGEKVFELNESEGRLREVQVGLSERQKKYLEKKGFSVIPRLTNDTRYYVPGKISELNGSRLIIFDGEELLGYPDRVDILGLAMRKSKMLYGYIEIVKQDGDLKLRQIMKDRIIRVHSVPKDELVKINKAEALDRFARAARERNVQLIYLRPFLPPQIEEDPVEYNLGYFGEIKDRLEKEGMRIGRAQPAKAFYPPGVMIMVLGLGVFALVNFLLDLFFPMRWFLVWPLLFGFAFAMLYIGAGSRNFPLEKGLALLVAISMPAYAIISQVRSRAESKRVLLDSLLIVLNIMADTFIGIFLIVGLLSNTEFMLGAQTFAGVKLALALPILLIVFYFMPKSRESIRNFLNQRVPVSVLIVLGILSGVAGLMLLRSGNFMLPVPGAEKYLRNLLETLLAIRPRTKEFLIGYPALMLGAAMLLKGRKEWLWIFLAVGAIAPISVLNTFSHIHTPLLISVIRTMIGLGLGLIIGTIVAGIYLWGIKRFSDQ